MIYFRRGITLADPEKNEWTLKEAINSGYDPTGDKKLDIEDRRVMHITCRMLEKDHEKFKKYCEEHEITLSDCLNDFATAIQYQNFGEKVAKFLEKYRWKLVSPISGGILAQETQARTRKRKGELIKEEVSVSPVHCDWCNESLEIDLDSGHIKDTDLSFADGQVFCSWECNYHYLDAKANTMKEKYLCTKCRRIHRKTEHPPMTVLNPLNEEEYFCEKCVEEIKGKNAIPIPEEHKYRCSVCTKEKDKRNDAPVNVTNQAGEIGILCTNCFNITFRPEIKKKLKDRWKIDTDSQE